VIDEYNVHSAEAVEMIVLPAVGCQIMVVAHTLPLILLAFNFALILGLQCVCCWPIANLSG
jgi:hypothetical protein